MRFTPEAMYRPFGQSLARTPSAGSAGSVGHLTPRSHSLKRPMLSPHTPTNPSLYSQRPMSAHLGDCQLFPIPISHPIGQLVVCLLLFTCLLVCLFAGAYTYHPYPFYPSPLTLESNSPVGAFHLKKQLNSSPEPDYLMPPLLETNGSQVMPLYGHVLLHSVDCLLPAPESPECKSETPLVCGWKSCGLVFSQLEYMVSHIKSDHIIQVRSLFVCLFVVYLLLLSECGSDAGVRLPLGGLCATTEVLQGPIHASHPPEETHGRETTQVSVQALL